MKTKRRVWTDRELAYLRAHYKRDLTAAQIAAHLGRRVNQVYCAARLCGLAERRQMIARSLEFLTVVSMLHGEEYSDSEIAAEWSRSHPDQRVVREWVTEIRRDVLGLPAHGPRSQRYRPRGSPRGQI